MFITLERFSDASKVNRRMFITLERPSEAGEDNAVLIKYNHPTETIPKVSSQMGILPNPPYMVVVSIITMCSIHC